MLLALERGACVDLGSLGPEFNHDSLRSRSMYVSMRGSTKEAVKESAKKPAEYVQTSGYERKSLVKHG